MYIYAIEQLTGEVFALLTYNQTKVRLDCTRIYRDIRRYTSDCVFATCKSDQK